MQAVPDLGSAWLLQALVPTWRLALPGQVQAWLGLLPWAPQISLLLGLPWVLGPPRLAFLQMQLSVVLEQARMSCWQVVMSCWQELRPPRPLAH